MQEELFRIKETSRDSVSDLTVNRHPCLCRVTAEQRKNDMTGRPMGRVKHDVSTPVIISSNKASYSKFLALGRQNCSISEQQDMTKHTGCPEIWSSLISL